MNVTLDNKKGLCECDEIKDHEMRDYPGLSGWTLSNHHKCPDKREAGGDLTAGNEKAQIGATRPQVMEYQQPPKAGRGKNRFSPGASRRNQLC